MKTIYPRELIMKFKVVYNIFRSKHCAMSLTISVSDSKDLKVTNFFHYFFKANFKKTFSYELILDMFF